MSLHTNRFVPSLQMLDAREVPAVLLNAATSDTYEAHTNDHVAASDCAVVRVLDTSTVAPDGGTGDSAGYDFKVNKKV